MALISIREYGKLHIGVLDPLRPSITSDQATHLTDLRKTYGFEIFKYVNGNTLAAQQYVGVVQLGQHTIEVLPKVDGDEKSVRQNLVAMLAVAIDLEISEGDIAQVATQNHGILEILIRLFCDKLFAQVHRGLVRRYEGREENLTVLRGRLGVVEQVRLNAANPERLFCRFDEFQEDNPLNQVLKAAIRLLLKVSRELTNQRQLGELLLAFEGVSLCPVSLLPWNRIGFDRLNDRFKPCFKLAELFLKKMPPDVSGGGVQGFSLFFEMNTLFEEYIGRIAARVFQPEGFNVVLQGPQRHLAIDEKSGQAAFSMKPDIVGLRGSEVSWIMDTKWKMLTTEESKEGVAQSDLYQMYAYANCYECPEVVLLYPHHRELGTTPGVRGLYTFNSCTSEKRLRVATIDLTNLKLVPTQIKTMLRTEV